MSVQLAWWLGFVALLLVMLALDLGVFHRRSHVVKTKEALTWTLVWFVLAMLFNAGVYWGLGAQPAIEFLTGYLVEKSLAIDNIFVIALIFSYFHVPAAYQHKVLFWGVFGALVMRLVFILAGIELLARFHWTIYLFGGLLIFTGLKMLWAHGQKIAPEQNRILRWLRRILPVTEAYEEDRLIVRRDGQTWVTPLFLVLVFVELTDLVFAVDSIPAILAITQDQFIVFSSNALAILGLRSLYFALAGLMEWFRFLHYGLSAILIFVGGKMLAAGQISLSPFVSLGVIVAILAVSIGASILWRKRSEDGTTMVANHKSPSISN